VIQSLPGLSDLSSPSTAVAYTPVSSASTSTPVAPQAPAARRTEATAEKQSQTPSISQLTEDTSRSGVVPVSSTVELDKRAASKTPATTELGRDRFQADPSSIRRSAASDTQGSRNQTEMVVDDKDAMASRRGRLTQPSTNATTSTAVPSSFQVGQINTPQLPPRSFFVSTSAKERKRKFVQKCFLKKKNL